MMRRVKKEETARPKMMAVPRALQRASERVIGTSPRIVENDVMKIASILDLPASMMASSKLSPLAQLRFILSIRMIAFFTTIPKRARMPMSPGKERGIPKIAMPTKTPIIARGSGVRTIIACVIELN